MKKADKAILEANPNASPHDLLLLGMSESGFQEMVAEVERNGAKAQTYTPMSEKPRLKPSGIIHPVPLQPVLSTIQAGRSNKVRLIPPNGGGGTLIGKDAAERFVKSNPKYKINYNG